MSNRHSALRRSVTDGREVTYAVLTRQLVVLLLVVTGCTSNDESGVPPTDAGTGTGPPSVDTLPSPGGAAEPERPDEQPTAEHTGEPSAEPAVPPPSAHRPAHPISVEALIETEYDGRGLRVGRQLADAGAHTRRAVSYRSQELRISGIINMPDGRGPFPVLVLNHGYIDPAIYVTGQG